MITKRHEETQNLPGRIQRTYTINNSWYFELRGGGQKGPYDSEKEMKDALNEFIQLHNDSLDKV